MLAALVVAAASLALGLRQGRYPPAPLKAVVTMTVDRFVPERVNVRLGGTVEWKNTDTIWHTVTADPQYAAARSNVELPPGAETFHSDSLWPGDVYRRTFPVEGTYKYFCQPHEAMRMVGWIEVVR